MTKYKKYCRLRDAKHLSDTDVARESGVSRSTFSDWKYGRCEPKEEKLRKIASFFGVPIAYFSATDEETDFQYDKETAELAQTMFGNEYLIRLLKASKKIPHKNLIALTSFIEGIVEKD